MGHATTRMTAVARSIVMSLYMLVVRLDVVFPFQALSDTAPMGLQRVVSKLTAQAKKSVRYQNDADVPALAGGRA